MQIYQFCFFFVWNKSGIKVSVIFFVNIMFKQLFVCKHQHPIEENVLILFFLFLFYGS